MNTEYALLTPTILNILKNNNANKDNVQEIVENIKVSINTTPIKTLAQETISQLQTLEHIDDKSFKVKPSTEKEQYTQEFLNCVYSTQNNQDFANFILSLIKSKEALLVNFTQLDSKKIFGNYKYSGSQHRATGQVTLLLRDFPLNKNMENFIPIIKTIENQVRDNIWGFVEAYIQPVEEQDFYALTLNILGSGTSDKAAIEIWVQSAKTIQI